jgi:hypothetical protein
MSLEHLSDAELMLLAAIAMSAWGADEDGIPDREMRIGGGRRVNPMEVTEELYARSCPATNVQNCTRCARRECVDNARRETP